MGEGAGSQMQGSPTVANAVDVVVVAVDIGGIVALAVEEAVIEADAPLAGGKVSGICVGAEVLAAVLSCRAQGGCVVLSVVGDGTKAYHESGAASLEHQAVGHQGQEGEKCLHVTRICGYKFREKWRMMQVGGTFLGE